MAISNLETTIDDIEQLIATVRPDSKGKIMLPKDELMQLLTELKNSIPSEIKRFSKKTKELEETKNKDIEEARSNAQRIMNEANAMRDRLLDESEQIKIAEEKADQIIQKANAVANDIIMNSEGKVKSIQDRALKEYDDSLVYMINFIQTAGQEMTNMLNNNVAILKEKLNEVMNSRKSLYESIQKRQEIEKQKNMMANMNNNQMNNNQNGFTNNSLPTWA